MNKQNNPLASFDRFINEISGDLARTTVGMNRVFDGVRTALGAYDAYPPFNFIDLGENKYNVVFALAGFTKEDLKVEVKENWLTIEGTKEQTNDSNVVYRHRGIANRSFKRLVQIASDVVVNKASMENGLLIIELEQVIPEEKKPKVIEIK